MQSPKTIELECARNTLSVLEKSATNPLQIEEFYEKDKMNALAESIATGAHDQQRQIEQQKERIARLEQELAAEVWP